MQRQLISSRTATLVVSEVASNGDYKLNRQQWWQVKLSAIVARHIDLNFHQFLSQCIDFQSHQFVPLGKGPE